MSSKARRLSIETKQTNNAAKYKNKIGVNSQELSSLSHLIKARIAETRDDLNRSGMKTKTFSDEVAEVVKSIDAIRITYKSLEEKADSFKERERTRAKIEKKVATKICPKAYKKVSVFTFDSKIASDFQESNCDDLKRTEKSEGIFDPLFFEKLPVVTPSMTGEELWAELAVREPTVSRANRSKKWLLDKLKLGTICIVKAREQAGAKLIDKLPRVNAQMTTAQLREELLYRDPSKRQLVRSKWKEWFLYQLSVGSIRIAHVPSQAMLPLSPQYSVSNTVDTAPTYFSSSTQGGITENTTPEEGSATSHSQLQSGNCSFIGSVIAKESIPDSRKIKKRYSISALPINATRKEKIDYKTSELAEATSNLMQRGQFEDTNKESIITTDEVKALETKTQPIIPTRGNSFRKLHRKSLNCERICKEHVARNETKAGIERSGTKGKIDEAVNNSKNSKLNRKAVKEATSVKIDEEEVQTTQQSHSARRKPAYKASAKSTTAPSISKEKTVIVPIKSRDKGRSNYIQRQMEGARKEPKSARKSMEGVGTNQKVYPTRRKPPARRLNRKPSDTASIREEIPLIAIESNVAKKEVGTKNEGNGTIFKQRKGRNVKKKYFAAVVAAKKNIMLDRPHSLHSVEKRIKDSDAQEVNETDQPINSKIDATISVRGSAKWMCKVKDARKSSRRSLCHSGLNGC